EVEEGKGVLSTALGADGTGGKFLYITAGGTRMPATYETVEKKLHSIVMDGSEVFKFAARKMADVSLEALEKAGLTLEDINYLVPHQANIRIIQNAAKRLKVSMDKVYLNIQDYGNISAASVPVALDEASKKGCIKQDDIVLLVGFGAGLTWGAAILKWGK
ncbi:MAG: 3-oxoacyl-ACP synthase, partial [Clostridia bacterium]|nr:3-oxoacyl-ACP synthase [Clostridia bacterium]